MTVLMPMGGCTIIPAPSAYLAQADTPATWISADMAGSGGRTYTGDIQTAWWLRFNDSQLNDLIGRAVRANTSINTAQAALGQARALSDVAAAALGPTVGTFVSTQTGTAAGNSTGTTSQLGLSGSWVPDVFGARREALRASQAATDSSLANLGDVRVLVIAEVALNYITLRSTQARLAIANVNLASQQETLQITDWRNRAGLVTALELEQARAAALQTEALIPALQTGIRQTTFALEALVGQTPGSLDLQASSISAGSDIIVPESNDPLALSIPADTLRQRASVRAAEYQVLAALARVGQARAQRLPSFSIDGSISLSTISAAALGSGTSVLSNLLANINLPIFDGGAARARVRGQQAALEQAQQAYRAAVLETLKEVESSLVALSNNRRRLNRLGLAANAAANAAQLARQRYGSGLVDFQIVLETQRNQLATQDGVVAARAELGSDQVRLFTALGGGWRMLETERSTRQ